MITHLFAGIPVAQLDAAVAWYERLTGRPPDLVPNEQEAAWQLSDTGWIYLIADGARAGSGLSTLLVEDLDAFLAEVGARGLLAPPIEIIGEGVRRTVLSDPDGNRLQVGQPPRESDSASPAR
ncbi:MAG TPA: VOC family protein [Solirubrobacteraceae bacterium]|jgi:catechol 2,3-dioxygenase-like lactoylglutathione lyase family enzyme